MSVLLSFPPCSRNGSVNCTPIGIPEDRDATSSFNLTAVPLSSADRVLEPGTVRVIIHTMCEWRLLALS